MKDRPAFQLKRIMIVYNFALVMLSIYMFIEVGRKKIMMLINSNDDDGDDGNGAAADDDHRVMTMTTTTHVAIVCMRT